MRFAGALVFLALLAARPAFADDTVARGKYLAILGDCAGCHTAPHQPAFSGGLPFTAAFGTLYSTNITPDRDTGIGRWTGEQFYRALHQGIAADGSHLYPAFPYLYFTRISRGDTDALFAYLRSLTPVHKAPARNHLIFPFNIRSMMFFWNLLFLDEKPFAPDPAKSAAANRGAYIVNGLGHCAACHTPKNILFGDEADKALTGGVQDNWFAANLTADRQEGLGLWSQADLAAYFATGLNAHATAAGSMEEKVTLSTSHMTGADRAAIAAYLKSLAPHPLSSGAPPDAKSLSRGEAIFVTRCSACHAPPGVPDPLPGGRTPAYPKLAGDTLVVGRDPTTVLRILLQGVQSPQTANAPTGFSMPGFAAMTDEEIADTANYIRNSWGNRAGRVTAKDVATLRHAIAVTPGD